MKTVWKYSLTPNESIFGTDIWHEMPVGAEIIAVDTQHGSPQMWAVHDVAQNYTSKRHFIIVGTGHDDIEDEWIYVGTFQVNDGSFVFHVYEVPEVI